MILQKLTDISIEYAVFKNFVSSGNLDYNREILVVTDLPLGCINNELVNFINNFDFPIIMKTVDYHSFVVNNSFLNKLGKSVGIFENVLKESYFDIIDRMVLSYLKKSGNFNALVEEFRKNCIDRTIDAFTTKDFYEFYNDTLFLNTDGLEIYFLLDNKFFLSSPEVLLNIKCLGIKFFIDGTISSGTAWIYRNRKNLFLDEKEFDCVLELLDKKFKNLGRIYLAFHCIGWYAFEFLVKNLAKKILKKNNLILRVEHCSLIKKKDIEKLIDLIRDYNAYGRVFLVLNPEKGSISIMDLYGYKNYFYVAYASDAPVYGLDLIDSIFVLLNSDSHYNVEIVNDIFRFNDLLFLI
ncbi:MAG: hypothetical protein RMJ36_07045 [Candidatus Calescibacterium sp.]|nr:hypothetical protein [Candidatus Calescibacterium sp.]MDW8133392.1 hypothetical protein [Candidatus Calescibacterium sp.]